MYAMIPFHSAKTKDGRLHKLCTAHVYTTVMYFIHLAILSA